MDEERRAIVRARLTKAEGKIAAARADLAAGRWDTREIGDYDDFLAIEQDEATEVVSRAERFLDEARRWLAGRGSL